MFGNENQPYYVNAEQAGFKPTFFGKVMFFFAVAIMMSVLAVFIGNEYLLQYFFVTPGLIYVLFIAELALIFTARTWSTKVPLNRFLFALFAFITGLTIAPLISVVAAMPSGVALLSKALIITSMTFTATALIGWTTKMDLSGMRTFLMMTIIGMIIVSVIGIFIPWGNTFEMVFSGIGVLLFSAFTAYDFQKIKRFPEDRYIDAALMLYLDIFNLFIYILRLLLSLRNR
ncbi:Bax inhibitor-1/YccA family protein [Candidatus Peregrinibacteria bacterium]|nr:Bax inhibitor-1/YccA family protein [Candidatus Peregrinibacteria bacterium]